MKQRNLRPPRASRRPLMQEGAEGTKKNEAGKRREYTEPFTTERLCGIWEKILSDPDGRRALNRLDKAGFAISHLKPTDATFRHPSWADYIAALPLLPNRPSIRKITDSLRKYRPLVEELRQFAAVVGQPFTELTIVSTGDYPNSFGGKDYSDVPWSTLRDDLLETATMLERFLSWDYCVRESNPRNSLIAELRWTIRERTGGPHDRELNELIASAFRAAGNEGDCYIDATALDRIEKREKESRVKADKRIRSLVGISSPSGLGSTRNRRKYRKRV